MSFSSKLYSAIIVGECHDTLTKVESLLSGSNIDMISTVTNLDKSSEVIKKTIPQIIFLDIDHPTIDDVPSIAKQIRASFPNSAIVLLSRQDQYAATAFEIDAIDFLVKPLVEERFLLSLKKITRYLQSLQVVQNLYPLPVKIRGGIELIDQEKIAYLTSLALRKQFLYLSTVFGNCSHFRHSVHKKTP